jgi:hypothetical protein
MLCYNQSQPLLFDWTVQIKYLILYYNSMSHVNLESNSCNQLLRAAVYNSKLLRAILLYIYIAIIGGAMVILMHF